jgi:hypothetical protein
MKYQKAHNFAVVAVAAMLLATVATSMATSTDVFAYKKNQAASQANACGNGEIPTNVGCQNTGSQIQGDENAVSLAAQQTFPEAVTPIPPDNGPTPDECEACFLGIFTEAQLADFLAELEVGSLDEFCEALIAGEFSLGNVVSAAVSVGITGTTGLPEFIQCIQDILGIGGGN